MLLWIKNVAKNIIQIKETLQIKRKDDAKKEMLQIKKCAADKKKWWSKWKNVADKNKCKLKKPYK